MQPWPEPVERVASFLRATGAEARIEEFAAETPTAEAAADAIGCTLGQVVKSLVFVCDGSPVVALVPGDRRADSATVARLAGARRAAIARPPQVREATGFPPGAVAPFPLEHVPLVLVERTLVRHPIVWAGAGTEHHMVALSPRELVRLTRGRVEDVVRESP
jgi:prolyl-tRNA editing enzyme YbaK/EbsC (Cys-tRNA(Pro) deacylase)